MASTPAASAGQARLRQIPGTMPRLGALPEGCPFNPRCPKAGDPCRRAPRPATGAPNGEPDARAACWFPVGEVPAPPEAPIGATG
jgi:peptide/nickel transport system ATP-binding protein